MKYKVILITAILICLLALSGCGCSHEWIPADCSAPQTCALCGETQGEALIHQWSKASCTSPKTCSLCGETEGDALEHQWEAATCLTSETCTECGATQGEAPGHTEGSPSYTNINFNSATADYAISCEVCGELLDSGSGAMTTLHDGEQFLCTSLEYFDRILNMHKEDDLGGFGDTDSEGGLFTLIYWDTDFISRMVYKKSDDTAATPEDTFSTIYLNLGWNLSMLEVISENQHYLHAVPVMVACDPSLSHDEALELYNALMADSELSLCHNGLAYKLYYDEESASLTMSVTVE